MTHSIKVLVTGTTGFIGKHLSRKLAERGYTVHAIYRSDKKISGMQHPNIIFFRGDITDTESLSAAMKGCEYVFHLAAYAKVWARNKNTFEEINYQGTINVLNTAIKENVKKVVITSTAGVFGPSENESPVDEITVRSIPCFTEYERTKELTDTLIRVKYSSLINVCTVCPTRVFGPGELSAANSVTRMIHLYISGKFHWLPGNGRAIGNYVYVDDVAEGILLALEKGRSGECYILGGENVSFTGFFEEISRLTGSSYRLFSVPVFLLIFISRIMKLLADIFHLPPLITPGWVRKYSYNWIVSSQKARNELEYQPVSFKEGLQATLMWIKNKKT